MPKITGIFDKILQRGPMNPIQPIMVIITRYATIKQYGPKILAINIETPIAYLLFVIKNMVLCHIIEIF